MITAIDRGLESLLRASLPLPEDLGDVSFEAPERSWGAQLSRVTVNLFLFDVARSTLPPLVPEERIGASGRIERRPPMPLVQLSYLVSAWAGSVHEEHQLLGDVLACLTGYSVLPPEHLPMELPGQVHLSLPHRGHKRPGELWSALDARLKASFELEVNAVLDAKPWAPAAPAVTRVEGRVAEQTHKEREPEPTEPNGKPTLRRHRIDGTLVTEGASSDAPPGEA